MNELELLKGLPFPWSSTDSSAYLEHIDNLERNPAEGRRAIEALERLLVVAVDVAGIERRSDDEYDAWMRDAHVELDGRRSTNSIPFSWLTFRSNPGTRTLDIGSRFASSE